MIAQYIFIYSNGSQYNVINLRELRVFSSPSLTKTASVFSSVPNDANYPNLIAENLVLNVENRSTSSDTPTYDRNGDDIIGREFCYRVGATELYSQNNGLYELTLQFD